MTEYTPQTSASDRYAAARKALARFWNPDDLAEMEIQAELVRALEALITPPTQREMLERLGIRYTESAENGYVYIPLQMIDREDAP